MIEVTFWSYVNRFARALERLGAEIALLSHERSTAANLREINRTRRDF